jgi:hypothetical protein
MMSSKAEAGIPERRTVSSTIVLASDIAEVPASVPL